MKPTFCADAPVYVTEEELCNAANLLENFETLEKIRDFVCCLDDEVNAFTSRKIKPGDNAQFKAVGGVSWVWEGPNSFASTSQDPTITNVTSAAQGLYTVTITDAAGCIHKRQGYLFVDQVVVIEDDVANLPDPSTIDEGVIFIDETLGIAKVLGSGAWVDFPIADTRAVVYQGAAITPPALTGNVTHLGEFVLGTDNMIYYIDLFGNSVKFTAANLYNIDGALTGNRAVAGAGFSLSFTALSTSVLQAAGKISWDSTAQQYQFVTLPGQDDTQDRLLAIDASGNVVWRDQASVLGPPDYVDDNFNIAATTLVCLGDTISLYANPSGESYAWTGPDSFVSAAQNPTIAGATALKEGLYQCVIDTGVLTRTRRIFVKIVNCPPPEAFIS